MKPSAFAVAALLTVLASTSAVAQDFSARALAANCFTCHGTDGNSAGNVPPSLAGRPRGELFRIMKDFQSGKRPATMMHQQARGYTDAQLEAIAGYFGSVKPSPPRIPAKP
jgi:cytochrome c553